MVRPLVFNHSVLKRSIVITTRTHVNHHIVVRMVLVEVTSHIVNRITISLLEKTRSRKSHRNYTLSYVSQVQLLPVVRSLLLRTSHQLTHQGLH